MKNKEHLITWPLPVLGPHAHVVIQIVGQMIGNQVLSGDAHIDRIPVTELIAHALKAGGRDVRGFGGGCVGEENVVPYGTSHLLGSVNEDTFVHFQQKKSALVLFTTKSSERLLVLAIFNWFFNSI